jgi:hypothetical protein
MLHWHTSSLLELSTSCCYTRASCWPVKRTPLSATQQGSCPHAEGPALTMHPESYACHCPARVMACNLIRVPTGHCFGRPESSRDARGIRDPGHQEWNRGLATSVGPKTASLMSSDKSVSVAQSGHSDPQEALAPHEIPPRAMALHKAWRQQGDSPFWGNGEVYAIPVDCITFPLSLC